MKKINRNQKKKKNKKPRVRSVQFKAITTKDGCVTFNFNIDGSVYVDEAVPGTVKSCLSYKKDSGKVKAVIISHSDNKSAYFSQRRNIETQYDFIAAIDTDTMDIKGNKISITSSWFSNQNLKEGKNILTFHVLPSFILCNVRNGLNPEIIGWHMFFQYLLPLIKLKNDLCNKKIGLIVDSEQDSHANINSRKQAYYKDYFLPDNVSLLYASTDHIDVLPNKILKSCGNSNKIIKRKLINEEINLSNTVNVGTDDYSNMICVNYPEAEYSF
ncbi:MAG: hypothetical protein ACXWE6_14500 [Nitrososphaeraceae archaeon]